MTPSNTHPGTAARGLRGTFLQAASALLTARARRRSADRTRARPRLEGLEDRCVLSPPSPSSRSRPPLSAVWGITTGPDGNLWFAESSGQDRRDQPDDPRHHRVPHAHRQFRSRMDHGGPRRQPLVHRERQQPDRDDQPDDPRHHRVRHAHRRCRALRDHGGSRRQPLVHRDPSASKIGRSTRRPMPSPIRHCPLRAFRSPSDHGGPRRQHLVHRARTATRSG